MKTLTTMLSYSRPPVIMAVSGIAAIILFLAQPAVARAADVNEETAFIFNTFALGIISQITRALESTTRPARP